MNPEDIKEDIYPRPLPKLVFLTLIVTMIDPLTGKWNDRDTLLKLVRIDDEKEVYKIISYSPMAYRENPHYTGIDRTQLVFGEAFFKYLDSTWTEDWANKMFVIQSVSFLDD